MGNITKKIFNACSVGLYETAGILSTREDEIITFVRYTCGSVFAQSKRINCLISSSDTYTSDTDY